MTNNDRAFAKAFLDECERRLFEESLPRLERCLSLLTPEEIWHRPNAETVSVGNLVLHLCGNVRQWIVAALGGKPDTRERAKEFSEPGPIPTQTLLQHLRSSMQLVKEVLHDLDPSTLLEQRTVQGFEESGVSILVHVVEHFSYHVGQITYFVKSNKAIDLAYYGGKDLNRTG
ncbi:MAG: DinB family protein [bacterium]